MPDLPVSFQFKPLAKQGLSKVEHVILFTRWFCLAFAFFEVMATDRLSDRTTLTLLGSMSTYLVLLEILVRLETRFRPRMLQISLAGDLLIVAWSTAVLNIDLTGVFILIILVAALRYESRMTLLTAALACILSILLAFGIGLANQADLVFRALIMMGVGILGGYLGGLRENERREKERLNYVERSKSDLLSLVSHEFRTPLAMIKGAVGILLEESPGSFNSQQHSFLTTIGDSCERLIKLVEDHLALAWLEHRKLELKRSSIDVRIPVRNAVQAFRPLATKKAQNIYLDYPQVVTRVNADEYWVHQVVTNLLSNGSKFTSEGGHIFVSVHENQHSVLVSVTDDGAGIPLAERQKIFEPFFKGEYFHTPGTGLGLSIVRLVIEQHGGKVLIDSTLGQGTTFLVTLPKVDAEKVGSGRRSIWTDQKH